MKPHYTSGPAQPSSTQRKLVTATRRGAKPDNPVLLDLNVAVPSQSKPSSNTKPPATKSNQRNLPPAFDPFRRPLTDSRNVQQPHAHRRSHRHGVVTDAEVPAVLVEPTTLEEYTKRSFLGEGGFARCYKVSNTQGRFYAAKVISKSTLREPQNKQKLFAEINIHRSMKHRTIVRFYGCFEDSNNVYLIVELCENKTLADMIKRRVRITEEETRYFLVQLLEACRYMHDNRVIHRDIKLSNIFLDKNMDPKLGDFGLAALLLSSQDRKKTVCGTPNYIAPEILFPKKGHDHKVDLWSIGVVMFTLLVGKHPFQQSDVKQIYKKIRENSSLPTYTFPSNADVPISDAAKDLISKLLVNDPTQRLSVPEILQHPFFQEGRLPENIPVSARKYTPTEEEMFPKKSPQRIMASPGSAGDALRRAIDVHTSYVDRKPEGPLRLMSQSIPDPRAEFPMSNKRQPSQSLGKRSPPTERTARKRRDVAESPKRSPTKSPATTTSTASSPLQAAPITTRGSIVERMYITLDTALKKTTQDPGRSSSSFVWSTDTMFMDKWVELPKYGLGYSLINGARGALFNDATSLTTNDDKSFNYIVHGNHGSPSMATVYHIDYIPKDIEKKVRLMASYKSYMEEKLMGLGEMIPEAAAQLHINTYSIPYVSKYVATEQAVVFRLSNCTMQFNFFNHTKLVLTKSGRKIIHISPSREVETYRIEEAIYHGSELLQSQLRYAHKTLGKQVSMMNEQT